MEVWHMVKRAGVWVSCAVALGLAPIAGCGGDDGRRDDRPGKAIDGTFVGKLAGTDAFVAVVASPAARGKERRDVNVYVTDGERLSAWLPGSAQSNRFTASSDDRDAEVKGSISRDTARGTVKLANGKTVEYQAARATGPAGLYDLTLSATGKLTGASATGVGLTGEAPLRQRGSGTLKLADGKRRKFDVTAEDSTPLRAGQLRLIILRGGELRGAADSGYYVRSSS
jgi:hypothetical protein